MSRLEDLKKERQSRQQTSKHISSFVPMGEEGFRIPRGTGVGEMLASAIPQETRTGIVENLQKVEELTKSEVASPIVKAINTAAFNLPAQFLEPQQKADLFLKQTTLPGKALNVAGQLAAFGLGGAGRASSKVASMIGGKSLLSSAGRGAAAMGTFGFLQTPDTDIFKEMGFTGLKDEDKVFKLRSRAAQGVAGAIVGSVLAPVATLTGRGLKAVSKGLKAGPKAELQQLELDMQKQLVNLKDDLKVSLQGGAEQASLQAQKLLPKVFKKNSQIYGKSLDKIAPKIPITRGNVEDIVRKTLTESENAFIKDGAGIDKLRALADKYQTAFTAGKKGIKVNPSKLDNIPFKELLNDVKNIQKALSAGTKKGTQGVTGADEIPIAIFQKNLGEYITSQSGGVSFNKMQKLYQPIIQAKIKANQIFKPFKGQFETKTGTEFIKKAASGKLERGEKAFFDLVKKGGKKFKAGTGDIDLRVRETFSKISSEINKLEEKGIDVKKLINDRDEFDKLMTRAGVTAAVLTGIGVGASSVNKVRTFFQGLLE